MLESRSLAARRKAKKLFSDLDDVFPKHVDNLWTESMNCVCRALSITAMTAKAEKASPYEVWHGRLPAPTTLSGTGSQIRMADLFTCLDLPAITRSTLRGCWMSRHGPW